MKNAFKIFIFIAIVLGLVIGIFVYWNNKNNYNNGSSNYEAGKTSTQINETNSNDENSSNSENNTINQNVENENNNINSSENPTITNDTPQVTPLEEEISSFSTKIVTKDANRQHNINLTCSTLNDTVVENGDTFSFCNTVGQATSDKGYKKADIFDANGNKKKGLGGGNCQISSTLYNAVLAVSYLPVVERHAHSNYVPYIEKGKDAAVAYGSYDFKFKNDSGSKIKITASATENEVTIKLFKIT